MKTIKPIFARKDFVCLRRITFYSFKLAFFIIDLTRNKTNYGLVSVV